MHMKFVYDALFVVVLFRYYAVFHYLNILQ